jgi:hypothetical protein
VSKESSEFSDGDRVMSASAEAQNLLKEIALPFAPEGGVKEFLRVLMARTGYAHGRLRGIYHGSVKVSGDELLHLQNVRNGKRAAPQAAASGAEREPVVIVDREYFEQIKSNLVDLNAKVDALTAHVARSSALASARQRGRGSQ